jgi:cytochrome c biogenesis protein CcdA/glutaredoxin
MSNKHFLKKIIILFFLISLVSFNIVFGNISIQNNNYKVPVVVFYGQGCPHCAALINWIESLDNSSINLTLREVYFNETNRNLVFNILKNNYNQSFQGVPTFFIGKKVFVGFDENNKKLYLDQINYCIENKCSSVFDDEKSISNKNNYNSLTLISVILAALIDAINPCAFAVLIILLSSIFYKLNTEKNVKKAKRTVLFSGILFSISIYISYFLMGLGIYSVLVSLKFSHNLYVGFAIFAIVLGFLNLKDYFWYGKYFKVEVPESWRPRLRKILKSITSPIGAFFIGFLVSLFLLPCTSGPYLVIIGMLSNKVEYIKALMYLMIYNFIFILPMILITLFVSFGLLNTLDLEKKRKKSLKLLHLIAGILLILIGLIMLFI